MRSVFSSPKETIATHGWHLDLEIHLCPHIQHQPWSRQNIETTVAHRVQSWKNVPEQNHTEKTALWIWSVNAFKSLHSYRGSGAQEWKQRVWCLRKLLSQHHSGTSGFCSRKQKVSFTAIFGMGACICPHGENDRTVGLMVKPQWSLAKIGPFDG